MSIPIFMKSKHIGYNVVAYGSLNKTRYGILEILQGASSDEGAAFPATSISINGEESIKNLRDFCNELLKEKEDSEVK